MGFFSKLFKPVKKLLGGAEDSFKSLTGSEKYKMADVKFEGKQNQLANMLMNQARGGGPNIAQQQMRKGVAQGLSNLRAGLQGMSGLSQGQKARMYSRQAGQMTRGLASEAGTQRAKEMIGARANLGNLILGSQAQQTSRSSVARQAHSDAQGRRQKTGKAVGEGLASIFLPF